MTPVVLQYPSPVLALEAGPQRAIAQLFPQASPALSIRGAKGVDATVYLSPDVAHGSATSSGADASNWVSVSVFDTGTL